MKRAVLISLGAHVILASLLGLGAWWGQKNDLPPVRVYTVSLVGPSVGQGKTGHQASEKPVKKPQTENKKASAKTDRAPSSDSMAPKGAKRAVGVPSTTSPQKAVSDGSASGQARGGATRLDTPFPFPEYLQDVLGMIDEAWEKPASGQRKKASVYFRIQQDGTVTDLKLEMPSGIAVFDQSVLLAVTHATPLPALPEGFEGRYLGIHFDFED